MASVAFATPDGGTTAEWLAIVDSGAPLSMLPLKLWRQCAITIRGESTIRGIVRKRECELDVQIGDVTCLLMAEDGSIVPVPLTAYLAPTDDVALLLGCEGLLNTLQLFVDRTNDVAYLQRES
jgi:hypothetical protein